MNIQRLQQTLNELNQFGYSDKGINRIAYSEAEQEALQYMINTLEAEGLKVRKDAIGNVIARREGMEPKLPVIAFGSHMDTVYNGGQYDGAVGVVAGLEVIRMLNDEKMETKYPIELIIFACEESARFGIATIGSKAMTGRITQNELMTLKDRDGISFFDALHAQSLNVDGLDKVVRDKSDIKAFYELHVEQGIVLEHEQKQIGIVSGIAAPTRYEIIVKGQAAHSGATPMWLRKDAFTGAAEIVLLVEQSARSEALNGTVATVGSTHISPNAMNVVPGEVTIQVDIRGVFKASKDKIVRDMKRKIEEIKTRRNLEIECTEMCDELPVKLETNIIQSIKNTCKKQQLSYLEMPSGAGHDAMNMAQQYPTGMIFIPSKDGISHNKDEYTSIEEVGTGVMVLKGEIAKMAEVVQKQSTRGEVK